MATLDERFPCLSALVDGALGLTLEQLADRMPCTAPFEFFDLERLLAHVRDSPMANDDELFRPHSMQRRGYLATIEAFAAACTIPDPERFITKKLAAPRVPRPTPAGTEMLDTLAECSWGLWLHDRYGAVEAEKALPGGVGDADFCVSTARGPLWVDCISVAPSSARDNVAEYFATIVRSKWKKKFGARLGAGRLSSAIAVTLLKGQEHLAPAMIRDETIGDDYFPPDNLWSDCPGLDAAWFGTPPWHAEPHRPNVFTEWLRP